MNQCHFTGRLVKDPELRTVKENQVVNFTIAVNRVYKKGGQRAEEVAYLDCEAWDSGAEAINKFFKQGKLITVHASVKEDKWKDEKTGQNRSRLKFRVNSFDFPPINNSDRAAGGEEASESAPEQTKKASKKPAEGEKEIPF